MTQQDTTTRSAIPKPKLLLLHGMGGIGRVWRPVAAALESRFEILAPDQRAHGRSRPVPLAEDCSPESFGRDLVETLTQTRFFPVWVIGHSMGVRSALALAHLKPEWIQGLVLIDVGTSPEPGSALIEPLLNFLSQLPDTFPDRSAMRTYLEAHAPDPSYAPYLTAVSEPHPSGRGLGFPFEIPRLIQIHTQGSAAARQGTFHRWLHTFVTTGKPAYLLRGETSQVWSKAAFDSERSQAAGMPGLHYAEWPKAGHGLPFERRADFTEWLRRTISTETEE